MTKEKTVKQSISSCPFLVGHDIQSGGAPILLVQTSAKDSAQLCDEGLQTVLACSQLVCGKSYDSTL